MFSYDGYFDLNKNFDKLKNEFKNEKEEISKMKKELQEIN